MSGHSHSKPLSTQSNVRTASFNKQLDALPVFAQVLAQAAYEEFVRNPNHPSLRWHKLEDRKASSHKPDSYSVSVSRSYRAIYYIDAGTGTNVWYWIGTHGDYDTYTGG